jgi:hypothetical protein
VSAKVIRPERRPDWYVWSDPPAPWCRDFATVPGLQFAGDGQRVTFVTLHRSHLTLVPPEFLVDVELPDLCHYGGGIAEKLARKGINLRKYQAEDLPFLTSRRGSLLTYEMRLGKTLTACAAHDPSSGPLVVVGPLASRDVWRNWIEQVHGVPPIVLQGMSDPVPHEGYPAYFVHYQILDAHTRTFSSQKIGTLVLDEIHAVQNRKAQRTSAVNVLAPRAERIIGLSGTPMWNKPESFYSVLHMVTPGAWAGHHGFGLRYCAAEPGAHGWKYNGISHQDELRERLREVMIHRTWEGVLGHLPPVTRVVEPVAVTNKQLAELEARAFRESLSKQTKHHTTAGYQATLRRKLADLKITPAVDTAVRAMADGHKVTLWYWHNDVANTMIAKLREGGHRVFTYRGSEYAKTSENEAEVERFRAHEGPAVMVIGIAVGGVALDLSCSDYAIFAELDWIPANMQQAEMRTFHPSRPHVVVYLYADILTEQALVAALGVREGFQSSLGLGGAEIARMVFSTAAAA